MVPNCGVLTKRFGVPRFTMLSTLKASPRNSNDAFSVRRKLRTSAISKVRRGGPYTEFRRSGSTETDTLNPQLAYDVVHPVVLRGVVHGKARHSAVRCARMVLVQDKRQR